MVKNRDPGFQKSIPGQGSRWDPGPNADPCLIGIDAYKWPLTWPTKLRPAF